MVIRVDPMRLAYMAVPKAACASVKATLAAIDPAHRCDDPDAFNQKQVHRLYPTLRFRMHRWQHVQDHFRFTVVRDPLKRLLAVYTNRVVALGELHHCRNIRRGRINLPADPDPDFFFQNLSAYTAISSSIKHHALPAVVFTGADLTRYSRVYRTAEIPTLQTDLSTLVGREVKVPHFSPTDNPLRVQDLKPRTQQALAERLDHEYRHLEGYFINPFIAAHYAMAA